MNKTALITVLATLGVAFAATAQAHPLNIKPGLWEVTTQTRMQAGDKQPSLENMTAQQKAAIKNAMSAAGKPQSETRHVCLTEDKLRHVEQTFMGGDPTMHCSSNLTTSTDAAIAGTTHCSANGHTADGTFSYKTADPTHMTGTITLHFNDRGHKSTLTGTSAGRWLGASCGATQ